MDVVSRLDDLINTRGVTTEAFRRLVRQYFKSSGRVFPWRETCDPYEVLVSEVMLQQTQTERVLPKYTDFLRLFPKCEVLAQAPLAEVLSAWQGLGYYRRALNLQAAARAVTAEWHGKFPRQVEQLRELPGVGPYTAAAVAVFAFGAVVPMIETNIRTVYLYTFFPHRRGVADAEIVQCIEETLDRRNPRDWFYALMDLGVELKRHRKEINQRSKHYVRQSKFEGSHRQVRAAVLRLISEQRWIASAELTCRVQGRPERILQALSELEREGFVRAVAGGYAVRE
jgi:A/G-specific adenine glycosylase